MNKERNYQYYSKRMVESQIKARGIYYDKICNSMIKVPRHLFISGVSYRQAYSDQPLSIGHGQTISQPYIVAFMTMLLKLQKEDKVLEIGTGSGYQTAILAEIASKVYTIERIPFLLKRAKMLLDRIGYKNILYRISDGTIGWEEEAPFDKIIITAAAPEVPDKIKFQLSDNGIMVVPVGDYKTYQILNIISRIGNKFETRESIGCRFVPLIGINAFKV